jgi:hypothetical protein
MTDLSERLIQAASETRNIDHSNLMFEARRRIGVLENRLRFGVSLPKITPELRAQFDCTSLMEGTVSFEDWSQDAVDFACVLNATLQEQTNERPQKSTKQD